MEEYESVLCVKHEVFVYRIPARTSNRGYRAAEWKLDEPDWTGRLKVSAKGHNLHIRLEDKNTGELFAQCPVESYPSSAIEQVLDSSRYFVLRIQDGGRAAFIGLGFADRGDSFDLLVSIQDHFKHLHREETVKEEATRGLAALASGPKLDLGFKEGQTITINMPAKKSADGSDLPASTSSKPRSRSSGPSSGAGVLLPPPPGAGTRVAPSSKFVLPSQSAVFSQQQGTSFMAPAPVSSSLGSDLLVDFASPPQVQPQSFIAPQSAGASSGNDLFSSDWDKFTGAAAVVPLSSSKAPAVSHQDQRWVNFD